MTNPYSSRTVPFTDVASDFQKLSTIQDSLKDTYDPPPLQIEEEGLKEYLLLRPLKMEKPLVIRCTE
jgi:hypothetical protein